MVQVPILNGIYADNKADLRTSYPINMMPVPKQQGVSNGYLRPCPGVVSRGEGVGRDRGGIVWNGVHYRVQGSKFVSVNAAGVVTVIGDVGMSNLPASMDYGFDQLAIASAGKLYLWDGATLTLVTDPDLGEAHDVRWVDGYFMTTDGEFLVVTDLNNPTSVNPLKYGSSEANPDPVIALQKVRNEIAALNRHTIEFFDNVGGEFFPFQRIEGAQIQKGCVGIKACGIYQDAVAFVGGGVNEPLSVYVGSNGSATKIATREIETVLAGISDGEAARIVVNIQSDKGNDFLLIHLAHQTLVYDVAASQAMETPAWHIRTSAIVDLGAYTPRAPVWFNGQWWVGHAETGEIGVYDDGIMTHWGDHIRWEFGIGMLYNESNGAIIHRLELVALTGRSAFGADPRISTSHSADGMTWTQARAIRLGKFGESQRRLIWLQCGALRNWRVQRFNGTSDGFASFMRLEAQVEPLAW